MALNGIAPLIIFTFYREIKNPVSFIGPTKPLLIPTVPIPLYLEERITGLQLDDYDRDISIDVLRDGVSAFERVSGDVVNLKFRMQKDNIILSILTALVDRVIQTFDKSVKTIAPTFDIQKYKLTVFYDNIFIFDASLERFSTRLVENSDMREVSLTFSKRSQAVVAAAAPIARTVGSSAGLI